MFLRLLVGLCFLMPAVTHGLTLPKKLDDSDRKWIMETLGFGSSSKLLTNPFPLGGHSGFELGLSMEFIGIRNLNRVGCRPATDPSCPPRGHESHDALAYPRISLGKGLYNNVDLFFHFTPPMKGNILAEYGGQVRWSFFEVSFLPMNMSFLLHGNQVNISNSFSNQTLGTDLITGINVNDVALYFGGGFLKATGEFMGGTAAGNDNVIVDPSSNQLTASNTLTEVERSIHSLIGISVHHKNLFAVAQIDRYQDPVYSFKSGVRF